MREPATGSATEPVRIGVVGCGAISGIYLENLRAFSCTRVLAVADLDPGRARAVAAEHGVERALAVGELLADPDIEVVLNLTVPRAHFDVTRAALEAGKHVYSEKPLATRRDEGARLLELARGRGLLLGCAPDTFLGGGLQTCRRAIDEGLIGRPVGATGFMMNRGHESWHPSPAFYYQPGGGPLFDMGPYYLTALVDLLGPIARVSASASISFPERTITSEPLAGRTIEVRTPTHVAGLLEFASGAVGTLVTSFDVWRAELPFLEIYGSEGTLSVPDPNTFGGPVRLLDPGGGRRELPPTHPYARNSRGLGLADMAHALRGGGAPRASGELAFHVLDAMQGMLEAAEAGRRLELGSACARPAPMPAHDEPAPFAFRSAESRPLP